jgi:signal transduction histidine kinase
MPPKASSSEFGPSFSWQGRIDVLMIVLALVASALLGGMLWTRAHYPSIGLLAEPAPGGWRIATITRDSSEGGVPRDWLGQTLTHACSAEMPDQCVALRPEWMIDTPIALPSATAIREFVKGQQDLLALSSMTGQRVILHAQLKKESSPLGRATAVVTLQNSREFLTERYIIVLLTAVMIYTVGCAMLAFVRRTREVMLAFAMCAGFSLFMVMRSWYTDRTWAQPEETWWIVLGLFRLGVMVCAVSTIMTLWNMRLHNPKIWSPLGLCLVLCAVIALHSFGVIDSATWGYRYITFIFAILILAIALVSWWHARHQSDGRRLRSKTFGQILLIGYLPAIISIPLWTFRPDLPQIAFIQNMAVGVVGIPIVILVSQSANYQLHVFWWRLWLVLVAAVTALVGSALLVLVFVKISAGASLAVMAVLATFAIYLLRHWLEKRLIGTPPALETFVAELMQMQGLQSQALDQAWQNILSKAFAPQRIESAAGRISRSAEIEQDGDCLSVPALGSTNTLVLTGASNFTRSFGFADMKLAQSLLALAQQGLAARASFVEGAVQERRRIAADLHDDIGGKLLHLAGVSGAEGQYARNTLEDLRTITRGLSAQPRALPELLADIQYQLGQRAERANLDLDWHADLQDKQLVIGSRQSTVLASICSELMRNAMQHSGVQRIGIELSTAGAVFSLVCINDGALTDPTQWVRGLGTTSIRRRVHDLQGQCDWQAIAGGGVRFSATWPLHAWLAGDTGAFQTESFLPSN